MSDILQADAIRLRHMLDGAYKAQEFMQERDRFDLDSDEMLSLALL